MMKKLLLFCVAVALCHCGANQLWAASDPGDRFLEAYFLIQEGDAAQRQADWTKADAKFNAALEILKEIKSDSPDWNPHIIDFRLKYVSDRLAELKSKLQTPPAPAPPGGNATGSDNESATGTNRATCGRSTGSSRAAIGACTTCSTDATGRAGSAPS